MLPVRFIFAQDGSKINVATYEQSGERNTADDLVFSCKGKKVGIIRYLSASTRASGAFLDIAHSLCTMGIMPLDLDLVVGVGYMPSKETWSAVFAGIRDESDYDRYVENRIAPDIVIDSIRDVSDELVWLYDHTDRENCLVPSNAFDFIIRSDRDDKPSPCDVAFSGDLEEIVGKEKSSEIENHLVEIAEFDFIALLSRGVQRTLANQPQCQQRHKHDEKDVFDCFCLGYCDFPFTGEEVRSIKSVLMTPHPSIDVFVVSSSLKENIRQRIAEVNYARKFFMNSVRLWDHALSAFCAPLTISNWEQSAFDVGWKVDNMRKIGEVIGVDAFLKALQAKIPLSDILAGIPKREVA